MTEQAGDIVHRDINSSRKTLQLNISKEDQDILNPCGINAISDLGVGRRGIPLWGARTLSSEPLWRYVNLGRLLLYVEDSVDKCTQWVVFEPNDNATWTRVWQVVINF